MAPANQSAAAQTQGILHVTEPPGAYAQRPRLVVDASVVAAAVFQEEGQALAVAIMQARALVAPTLIDYELANIGLKKHKRELLPAHLVRDALDDYTALGIAGHTIELAPVLDLAERYALSAYDAAYLWLAAHLQAPLATFDAKLAAAAQRHLAGPEAEGADPPG